MLLPALWVNAKRILSEPLFCLLLLSAFFVLDSKSNGRGRLLALALLLAAMALTRTAGLAFIAVYALWGLTRSGTRAEQLRAMLPVLAAGIAYLAWVFLRPAETADDYLRIVLDRARGALAADQPWAIVGTSLMRQATAVAQAWVGGLLLFWVEGRPVRLVLAGIVGGFAVAGRDSRVLGLRRAE